MFGAKPLFFLLLENAQKGGLENFIIVANEGNKDAIASWIEKENFPAQITTQKNLSEGQAGGIRDGLELVPDDEAVSILGGNDYIEPSAYADVLAVGETCDGALLGKQVTEYFPGGYMVIDGENTIQNIQEKPGEGNEPSDMVNIIAHYVHRAGVLKDVFAQEKTLTDGVYEENILAALFLAGTYKAVPYDGIWQAVKYPFHVLNLMNILLAQQETSIHPSANIAKTAVLNGEGIVIEEGVKIYDHACIQGPCFIGRNTIVGNNTLVRGSFINADCCIGFQTEVARSFLAPGVTTHMAYVGDSVLGEKVNMGAYSVTTNLRLDQKTVRVQIKDDFRVDSHKAKLGAFIGAGAQIGSHAMLMPGCKISDGDFIMPGSITR